MKEKFKLLIIRALEGVILFHDSKKLFTSIDEYFGQIEENLDLLDNKMISKELVIALLENQSFWNDFVAPKLLNCLLIEKGGLKEDEYISHIRQALSEMRVLVEMPSPLTNHTRKLDFLVMELKVEEDKIILYIANHFKHYLKLSSQE